MASTSYEFQSVVRGHHVYKEIWTPGMGEELNVEGERGNEHDRYALSVVCTRMVVDENEEDSRACAKRTFQDALVFH